MTAAVDEQRKREAAAMLHRFRVDPVLFVDKAFGFEPWSKQREILEAVRDHHRVAVRSCHGVGKTATAAHVGLWFLVCHPGSTRVVTTAPTGRQVRELLWREIRAATGRSDLWRNLGLPKAQTTQIEIGEEWFAIGMSTDEPEKFQGHHADHLLLIVDEASGVDEEIFEAAEGYFTNENARVLLIGNPTQLAGQFHRAFHAERAQWRTIHVDVVDSPNYTGEAVSERVAAAMPAAAWEPSRKAAWGAASPMYQVRVRGMFPSTAENTVCALGLVEAAQQRWLDDAEVDASGGPLVVSCDVARFGSDETVIAERAGATARIVEAVVGRDTMQTAGHILDAARSLLARSGGKRGDLRLVVDDAGVGGGVTDRLREIGEFEVEAFNGGQAAVTLDPDTEKPAYPNRRSEAWFAFAEALPGVVLDADEQLCADLVAPTYKLDSAGRRVVEPKEETKKRLGRSPDRADAVLLLWAPTSELGAGDAWAEAYAEMFEGMGGIEK